ncbi:hypothetical protein N665_0550s0016 [Sinapis alba]|nr:hypothetical protein N665_0550s0016 [Sinapis alba]
MSLSPSASPAPADSPPATSSPPAPPLSPLPPPLESPPPLAPPPSILPPTASPPPLPSVEAPPSPPLEAPPVPPEEPPPVPPEEPAPSPPEEPPPSLPFPSGSPSLPFLPAKPSPPPSPLPSESLPPPVKTVTPPPPSLPTETTPPVNTASPPPSSPPRRRGPKPPLPPPIISSPPKPSPTTPSLPETSPPPKPPLSTPPFPSSSTPSPKNSPAATLPFFGPIGPLPDGTIATPNGPIIEPKTTPAQTISPGTAQPLVPKSLPETTSYHRSSAGFLFGGVIVGALLLVLLGLLFVFYRATRNRNNTSPRHQSKNPPKVQHQRGGNVESDQTNVITIPPLNYSSSVSYGTKESNAVAMNVTMSSGTFTYEELLEATGGFSEANLLGEGGFGYVHKGVLRNGREVAVKQLKIGSNQGEREFQAEVDTISRVHHKHLVSLVGYCINGDKRLLVYEFVPKDTLEFHLHGNRGSVLEWGMRLRIAVGAAKGLAYLHEDCSPTIIHRDIKAANILLDSKYEAKVSDFGLAKFFSDTNSSVTHISTRVVGTFGYMAPEYASSGKVTDKSDVYSFGVVLLELITGRPPIFAKDPTRNLSLVDWARPLLAKAISGESFDLLVDPRLEKNYDTTQMADMAACAASCIRQSAWLRPRMSQVIRALEGEVTLRNVEERYSSSENPNDNPVIMYGTSKRRFNTDSSEGSTSEYGINPSQSSSEQHQFTGSKV